MAGVPYFDVFLSHNHDDKAAVEQIATRLVEEAALRPFLDKWHLVPGLEWQSELSESLERSSTVAVFFGPTGNGPWHHEEMQLALMKAVREKKEFRVIPVILPQADPTSIPPFLQLRTWVDFSEGIHSDVAFKRLVAGVLGRASDFEGIRIPDEPAPYRGLMPFKTEHARFFFGRDQDIGPTSSRPNLVDKLRAGRFVAVVGMSGSGKSSIVRAGLLPRLAQDVIAGSRRWKIITFSPADDPFRSLAHALVAHLPQPQRPRAAEELFIQLTSLTVGLRKTLENWLDVDCEALLFIDQFEEVFTHAPNRRSGTAVRQKYEDLITSFAHQFATEVLRPGGRLRGVITVRADFIEPCLQIPDLKALLQDRQLLLGELGKDTVALREVIQRPAQEVGAMLETGLTEVLLADMGRQSGALPLLEDTLLELWRTRRGPWLTHSSYKALGGLAGALERRADQVFLGLDQSQREIARRIFVKLTSIEEGADHTRRRVERESLYPAGCDRSEVDSLIRILASADARLVVAESDSLAIVHDTLIHNWPRLQQWLNENRELERVHRELERAANNWQRHDRAGKYLIPHGSPLFADIEQHAAALECRLTLLEVEFICGSQQQRDAETRRVRRTRQRSAGVAVFAVIVTALAVLAWWRAGISEQQRLEGVIVQSKAMGARAEALAEVSPENVNALKLGIEAVNVSLGNGLEAPVEAVRGMVLALNSVRRSLPFRLPEVSPGTRELSDYRQMRWRMAAEAPRAIGLSPAGDRLFVAVESGFGEWDLVSGKRLEWKETRVLAASEDLKALLFRDQKRVVLKRSHFDEHLIALDVDSVAAHHGTFSNAQDKVLVIENRLSSPEEFVVKVFDCSSGGLLSQLKGHTDYVHSARFSRDGTNVITASSDGTAVIWRVKDGTQVEILRHEGAVFFADFSPDGEKVVTTEVGNKAHFWRGGAKTATLSDHKQLIRWAAFSSDGERLVTASDDRSARVWNTQNGKSLSVLNGHRFEVVMAQFGRRGEIVTISTAERLARVWSTSADASRTSIQAHDGAVLDLAFSPSGDQLVSAGADGRAHVWSTKHATAIATLKPHDTKVVAAALSSEGSRILTRSEDGVVHLSNASDSALVKVLRQDTEVVIEARFSPDGAFVLTLSDDGTLRRWRAHAGQLLKTTRIESLLSDSLQFCDDGKHIIIGGGDEKGQVATLDSETLEVVRTYDGIPWPSKTKCSPDNITFLTGSGPSIYRREDGALIKDLEIPSRVVWNAFFSHDGNQVITTDHSRVIAIWKADSGELIGFLPGSPGVVKAIAMSPSGSKIVTVDSYSSDPPILWDVGSREALFSLEGHSEVTSLVFSPSGSKIATGGKDGRIKLWEITPDDLLRQARTYVEFR
jgi:WD40 repeat protein/energy-coupling factor transporter ATP-binding protein EcfA2